MNSGATAPEWAAAGGGDTWNYKSAVATTSGSSQEFTSISSGVRHVWITLREVGNSTDAEVRIILGDDAYEATGYRCVASSTSEDGIFVDVTDGFCLVGRDTLYDTNMRLTGMVELVLNDDSNHEWTCWGMVHAHHQTGSSDTFQSFCGIKQLSAELAKIKLELSTGTFDTGAIIMHSE